MPYGTISGSISGQTFEPRQPGVYSLSGLTFSDPLNEFRVTGASTKKDGSRGGSVTRILQKDVTVGNSVARKQCIATLNISVPSDGALTAAEVDNLVADLSTFLTVSTVSRLLQGEA